MLYNFKGVVGVPSLEIVDDILDIQKCGIESIHCGKQCDFCSSLTVHDKRMHQSITEKYLGDHIHESAKNASTISKQRTKGYGIISEIMYILDAIPKDKKQIKSGYN